MTTPIRFEVVGVPTPQGSKTKMRNGAMLEGGSADIRARRVDWRNAVADAARAVAAEHGQLDGNLVLHAEFRFPMPASRSKAVRERGSAWKNTFPDLDKLVRSVGDSLTAGGLIKDDARLVQIDARKIETTGWTGVTIGIEAAPQ